MTAPTAQPKRLRWWAGLPLVVLVAAGGTWLLQDKTDPLPEANEAALADAATPANAPAADLGSWGTSPADEQAESDHTELTSTGRTEPIVDLNDEDTRSVKAYRQRIDDNISHLELAAEVARQQGELQRAELMEKRISGLERRLSEFEAEQAATPG